MPKEERIHVRADEQLKQHLESLAAHANQPMAEVVRWILLNATVEDLPTPWQTEVDQEVLVFASQVRHQLVSVISLCDLIHEFPGNIDRLGLCVKDVLAKTSLSLAVFSELLEAKIHPVA